MGPRLHFIRDPNGEAALRHVQSEIDEHLFAISAVLGKLPEPWWLETWEGRRGYFKDEADESGRVVAAGSNVKCLYRGTAEVSTRYDRPREGPLYELNKHLLEDILEREVELFSDHLAKLLRYCLAERVSPKESLDYGWFKLSE